MKNQSGLSDPDLVSTWLERHSVGARYANGWYQVLAGGNGLGFAKVTGRNVKKFLSKRLEI